jgi:TonB family protein
VSQPAPKYTLAARKNRTVGVVQLRVVLNANGKVSNVKALSTLPDGLTEEAMRAAMRVEFIPATVEGMPVTGERLLEYYFSER